jgi:hypothetical protein
MKKTMIILMMLTISSTSFANTICKENYLVVNGFSHHFAKKPDMQERMDIMK